MINNIEIVRLNSREELKSYFPGIADLFFNSFGKELDKDLWEWAYLDNPYGEPLVSIAVDAGKVVGHYAVVPFKLSNKSKESLDGYLSMTTMVHAEYRLLKLFKKLADDVYIQLSNSGLPAVVFGFPNDKSAPGFKKRLGWNVNDDYRVVKLPISDTSKLKDYLIQAQTNKAYSIDFSQPDIKKWRCNKPTQEWEVIKGIGVKKYSGGQDLMFLEDAKDIEKISITGSINTIMAISNENLIKNGWEELFAYRFGYRNFNCSVQPDFFVQMSMSDIF